MISHALKAILVVTICIVATQAATLHGRVVDARTGEPVANVRIIVSGTDLTTTTNDNGEFTFDNLPAGQVELYITTVNVWTSEEDPILPSAGVVVEF